MGRGGAGSRLGGLLWAAWAALLLVAAPSAWAAEEPNTTSGVLLAQAEEPSDSGQFDTGGRLEPTYQPREPEPPPGWYNASYLFGMTRSVANSTMSPGVKVPLFVLTVPLDIVFLPFAAIGGMFG